MHTAHCHSSTSPNTEKPLYLKDTTGTQLAVLFKEASLIQRQICTQLYVAREADSVHIREVSFIQSVLYREVPLYSDVVVLFLLIERFLHLHSVFPIAIQTLLFYQVSLRAD